MSKNDTISVIVSQYASHTDVIYGLSLSSQIICWGEDRDHNEKNACAQAGYYCRPGFMVIVRPQYNDSPKINGESAFHEYRSFDGGAFERVSW